ncbi:hypothetical protein QBC33DRAFT_615462 [Phialemonium atrogriseum]|uniref:Uncharacterized protein n=1 Tax=Phialemonium atrogriseum TaxID=1093897 RepID=A0AAJ0FRY5_9PEZI|nr:uncharacterized protein QBC33DRAFT_615462 [Phialemonium atrogriseum]KAK1772919.1 hypothetical protein QBC33DRAFT_615462 [Phialemonium atrogriseum]
MMIVLGFWTFIIFNVVLHIAFAVIVHLFLYGEGGIFPTSDACPPAESTMDSSWEEPLESGDEAVEIVGPEKPTIEHAGNDLQTASGDGEPPSQSEPGTPQGDRPVDQAQDGAHDADGPDLSVVVVRVGSDTKLGYLFEALSRNLSAETNNHPEEQVPSSTNQQHNSATAATIGALEILGMVGHEVLPAREADDTTLPDFADIIRQRLGDSGDLICGMVMLRKRDADRKLWGLVYEPRPADETPGVPDPSEQAAREIPSPATE